MYKTKINLQFSKPNNAKNKIKKIRIEGIDIPIAARSFVPSWKKQNPGGEG